MADHGARPLLPQVSRPFQNYNPVQHESREKQRNYVFVDEHNRHRRLKVMRACQACRKRKIRCDAATTNMWPCQACQKQQLDCVPPTSDGEGFYDVDFGPHSQPENPPQPPHMYEYGNYYPTNPYDHGVAGPTSIVPPAAPPPGSGYFSTSPESQYVPQYVMVNERQTPSDDVQSQTTPTHQPSRPPPLEKETSSVGSESNRSFDQADLVDQLGVLKINDSAVASYITTDKEMAAAGPAFEEKEVILPPISNPDAPAGIPPEMMPSEEDCLRYFSYFFRHIHPYVPVLSRKSFYERWQTNRKSVSPLILEGIFACVTHMLHEEENRARWVALGQKHEEVFKDTPRLSTIQGLLLFLKAREAVPKRGYYYRSWVTIQNIVSMGKDLELHHHLMEHQRGTGCKVGDVECITKTRVWNLLFELEVLIGGPQGRTEFSVPMNSIKSSGPLVTAGIDIEELKIEEDQIAFTRAVRQVRISAEKMAALKPNRPGDWGIDPEFLAYNSAFTKVVDDMPERLQISYPEDGSAPFISFHYSANIHCYALLAYIMHTRPQLEQLPGGPSNPQWMQNMKSCYSKATRLCRLQEAIEENYGLQGLMCMLRGINTSIYIVLTCTMLHLIAITAPDPELNRDAPDYFARHMRILERCSVQWPMPSMRNQIDSLRQAFSADLNQPFQLRPDFPTASANDKSISQSSPTSSYQQYEPSQPNLHQIPQQQQNQWQYDSSTMTPPQTATPVSVANAYQQDYGTQQGVDALPTPSSMATMDLGTSGAQSQWNPSVVIDSWKTAFNPAAFETTPSPGNHVSTMPQPVGSSQMFNQPHTPVTSMPSSYPASMGPTFPLQQSPHDPGQMSGYPMNQPNTPLYGPQPVYPQSQFMPQQHATMDQSQHISSAAYQQAAHPGHSFISPTMWQDAVYNSYAMTGSKRRWGSASEDPNAAYKRAR